MTETEFALLELRLLKSGTPYHIHKDRQTRRDSFICTSPYCADLFATECGKAPGETQEEAHARYWQGELGEL